MAHVGQERRRRDWTPALRDAERPDALPNL